MSNADYRKKMCLLWKAHIVRYKLYGQLGLEKNKKEQNKILLQLWMYEKGAEMITKFNIGDEVYIKAKVRRISVNEDGKIEYSVQGKCADYMTEHEDIMVTADCIARDENGVPISIAEYSRRNINDTAEGAINMIQDLINEQYHKGTIAAAICCGALKSAREKIKMLIV